MLATPPRTPAELERDILMRMPVLVGALDATLNPGPVAPGHASPYRARERIAQAIAALALSLQRVRAAQEAEARNAIRAFRTRELLKKAMPSAERMPLGSGDDAKNANPSVERMAPAVPPKRRRGAQPGNRNRLRHGRYTAEAKARRAALREALGSARDITHEARLLVSRASRAGHDSSWAE